MTLDQGTLSLLHFICRHLVTAMAMALTALTVTAWVQRGQHGVASTGHGQEQLRWGQRGVNYRCVHTIPGRARTPAVSLQL